ncbi:MAG: GTPase ObgE [Desulfobacterales bacterium]|nr:GTPase ObgE [Desulfobacterales bacterium]MDD4073328.1 GTPase ObgE [Desulfobacterales bacterium]MDD4391344.1 GTPase ObgE [Desulfobacterales bacterium]
MKFIDEATVTVQSGNGGRGCVSFRREKFIPLGGPDGGDGGDGGSVIFVASLRKRTLYHFRYQKVFKAQNGGYGQGKQKTGKKGDNIVIEIPPGTLVTDVGTQEVIKDFVEPGDTLVIAKGGRGGQGNLRFKTSTNRAPRFAQPGESGQTLILNLELKLLADVGIVGLPNAGKSTLISVISSAKPKIAEYPFTTITPNLGVVKPGQGEPFVVADIPGLIEGAHTGIGLGIQFLKHIERTRILVHLIDAAAIDPAAPLHAYDIINTELLKYSQLLVEKPQIVVLNKLDVPGAEVGAQRFRDALKDKPVLSVSAATRHGIDALLSQIVLMLDRLHE